MLQIRDYQPKDKKWVINLVLELKLFYPGINEWINKEIDRIERNESKCLVVELDEEIGGVAISALKRFPKKNDVVKLKTFYLRENFREYGLGPYLLERIIDEWVKVKAKKIYVTFAEEELSELKPFFDKYGFLVDGVSPLLYRDEVSEYIMSKVLVYKELTEQDFSKFIQDYLLRLRGYNIVSKDGDSGIIVERINGFKKQNRTYVKIFAEQDHSEELLNEIKTQSKKLKCSNSLLISYYPVDAITEIDGIEIIDGYDIENFFYPLRLQRSKYAGIIAPVRPEYASQLLYDESQALLMPHKKSLRSDKVFYKSPTAYKEVKRGSTFIFYVSDPIKAIIGEGKIEKVIIDTADNLYNKYERKGVLTLSEIKSYANKEGLVLAFVLGKTTRYPKAIPINNIRKFNPQFNPQGSSFISQQELDKIRTLSESVI